MKRRTKMLITSYMAFLLTIFIIFYSKSAPLNILLSFLIPTSALIILSIVGLRNREDTKLIFSLASMSYPIIFLIIYLILDYFGLWEPFSLLSYVFLFVSLYDVLKTVYIVW